MPILADVADAVIGVDTHADTHALQIAGANGVPIAEYIIANNGDGFAEAIAFAERHAPGPRVFFALEGSRSYGVGLSRALAAAGIPVIEVARPPRESRRRKGKTDRIEAGLVVLSALRMDVERLATPRSDGDREALRILLGARDELATTQTRQVNRLRALLLSGYNTDRAAAKGPLTRVRLDTPINRRPCRNEQRESVVRRAEIQRPACAIRLADDELTANNRQLTQIVGDVAPTLLERRGLDPVSAAQVIVSFSHPGRCRNDGAFASLGGSCPIPASSG